MTTNESESRTASQRWRMMMGESAVAVTNVAIQPKATEEEKKKPKKAGRSSPRRVVLVGIALIAMATLGFYNIPGMIDEKASGSHLVNSIYCAVMTLATVGFGDICPSHDIPDYGKAFIVVMSFVGLGMFCGPVMDLAASWTQHVPGGVISLGIVTIAIGVVLFTWLEEVSQLDAAYMSFIAGTTIGYGDVTPSTDEGKIAVALYTILVSNVIGGLLQPARTYLESLCRYDDSTDEDKKRK